MIRVIDVDEPIGLEDYSAHAHLALAVQELRAEAATLVPELAGRTLWMVNSTERGGGVAEMLPKMVALLRELGVDARWAVLETDRHEFFGLTKRLHNLIHGAGDPELSAADRELYAEVSRDGAAELSSLMRPGDLLVVHDPQPLGAGALVERDPGSAALWRCHIGLDRRLPATRAAWRFLEPYARKYDHAVFSAPEYIPHYLLGRATVIWPALDPLSHKNRDLSPHKLVGVLCNARLAVEHGPVLTPPFASAALRLGADGSWRPAHQPEEIGILFRPVVLQVSRWDRLKGFAPLIDAFERLKARADRVADERHRRRLKIVRLVLAGPDPASVSDDPEGLGVLSELAARYRSLPEALRSEVALISLAMTSRKENALMVNALQRCATVAVQNSLQEGFGLTVAEAMWKRTPVLGSRACGIRQQVRDGLDGRLVADPEDPEEIARTLDGMLADAHGRYLMGRSGQRRVHEDFLIFGQLRRWLETLAASVRR